MEIDVEKLIRAVESRQPLYNYFLKEHHHKDIYAKMWEEVAAELNAPVAVCKAKWNILRNSYARALRKMKTVNGNVSGTSSLKLPKRWYLADSMAFLKDYIVGRNQKKTDGHDSSEENDGSENINITFCEPEQLAEEDSTYITKASVSNYIPSPARTKMKEAVSRDSDLATAQLNDYLLLKSFDMQELLTENANANFLKSLIPDVNKLTARRQRQFREQVMIVLNRLFDEQEDEK